jgi:5-methylcytosine-specific restriction endonuclease McrA
MSSDDFFLEAQPKANVPSSARATAFDQSAEYKKYIGSAKWRNIRNALFKMRGKKCEACGFGSASLEVHHLTYERFGNENLADLKILCKPCHDKADREREAEQQAAFEQKREDWEAEREQRAFETFCEKKYGPSPYGYGEAEWEEFEAWRERKYEEESY